MTIADVAERAGVSQMTVSRVINSSAAVKPDKRARVERAIEELGYVPNRLARGLSARRLGVIAVLVPDLTNPYFTAIVHKIEEVANEQGLTVLLGNSDERPEREADFLHTVAALRVDGAIIGATGDAAVASVRQLEAAGIPVVALDRRIGKLALDIVLGATAEPAELLTEHLIQHGHKRIATDRWPVDRIHEPRARGRLPRGASRGGHPRGPVPVPGIEVQPGGRNADRPRAARCPSPLDRAPHCEQLPRLRSDRGRGVARALGAGRSRDRVVRRLRDRPARADPHGAWTSRPATSPSWRRVACWPGCAATTRSREP